MKAKTYHILKIRKCELRCTYGPARVYVLGTYPRRLDARICRGPTREYTRRERYRQDIARFRQRWQKSQIRASDIIRSSILDRAFNTGYCAFLRLSPARSNLRYCKSIATAYAKTYPVSPNGSGPT